MSQDYYILKGKRVVREPDVAKWGAWLQSSKRAVAKTDIGQVHVSTVFLGIDHGFGGEVALFETMIFGGQHDQYQERYATWKQAEEGHARAVALVKSSKP